MSATGKPAGDDVPERIGAYRIEGLLGEGSSGRVYLAQEADPPRSVALKVLRSVAVSAESRARFRREAELLAQLEHPDIARLYAAGVAEGANGAVPYLSMELVRGSDLVTHAREQPLDLRARAALLARIARAVHFAHTRGVVHRDLKPANLMVGADGGPKILDFGVAHVTRESAAPMTMQGEVFGTIPYMSPQQLAGASGADPAVDVYALGAIAYELFSGELPYEGLQRSSVIEAIGIVRSGRPRPLDARLPAARGDLNTIVMKALEQEPAQRYGSAAEFAADLERYLAREPIGARPPTASYVAGLFVRRHKAIAAATGIVALALLGASLVSVRYGVREARAQREASQRAAEAEAVSRFMTEMLENADPYESKGAAVTVLDALGAARKALEHDTALSPAARAKLYETLANNYGQLGELDTALQLVQAGIAAAAPVMPADATRLLALRGIEGTLLRLKGRSEEALTAMAPVLAIERTSGEREKIRIEARMLRAALYYDKGDVERDRAALAPVVAEARETLGPAAQETLEASQSYAAVLHQLGRYDEGLPLVRELLKQETAALGADHPLTLMTRQESAQLARETGDLAGAETQMRATVADRTRVLGAEHYSTLAGKVALGQVLLEEGKVGEAAPLAESALEAATRTLGPDQGDTLLAMNLVGRVEQARGNPRRAEELYRKVIAVRDRLKVSDGQRKLGTINNLGTLLIEQHRDAEAAALYADLVPRAQAALADKHPLYAAILGQSGWCALERGDAAAARPQLEQALALLDARAVTPPAQKRELLERLLRVYTALGRKDESAQAQVRLDGLKPAG